MKSEIKYTLLFILCMFLLLLPIGFAVFLGFLSGENITIDPFFYKAAGIVGGISFLSAFIVRGFLREAREDREAERISRGKGKSFKTMTKQERDIARTQAALEQEAILSGAEYKNILKKGSKKPDEDLQKLVGLKDVKESVLHYKAQIQKKTKTGSKHMCFLGNPGTGKTTVVSIITAYLHRYGYIKRNEYISVDGNFFKSSSEPLTRTRLLLAKAHGKVLFIDEAYALVQGNLGIGQEVLATILNEMENNRENMIIILAGYKKEMKDLFAANSGLSSRIKNYFMFEDYSIEELKQIFTNLMYEQQLVPTTEAMDRVETVLIDKKKKKTFANARTARNLAEKALAEHAYNLMIGIHAEKYRLMPEDILLHDKEDDYFS